MPVAADDVVWLDVLPSMGRFRQEIQNQSGSAANAAGAAAGTGFTSNFAKHLKVAAVLGGALAVGGAFKFMQEATREASNLGESLNAVNVTFGKNAAGINELGKAAAQSVGLSQSQFNGLAVQFSAFATTIAGDGGNVTGVMKDLTTRGADFASVMNLDVNEAMGLFQSGLAGETEPLRKYGIDLSAAAVENYALANGIVAAGEEMTEAQKVQARYAYLMEQTSKVQGDFSNTSDSLANSQRILTARWDDIQATVGMKVIPILEKFSGWVLTTGLPAIMSFGGWIRDNLGPIFSSLGDFLSGTFLPKLQELAGVVLPALWTAFQNIGSAVSTTVGFFREHETAATALGIAVGLVAALVVAAWVTQATVSAVNSARAVAAWIATATASTTAATIQSRSTAQIVVGWVAAAAAASFNALKVAAAWAVSVAQTGILMAMYASQSIASAASSSAAWVVAQVRTLASLAATAVGFVVQGAVMVGSMAVTAASVVAGWVLMGVQSLIQAARMAAAWLIAMGPIGLVIAAVVGLVALIIANWDTIVRWTTQAWTAVVDFVKAAASMIRDWVVDRFNNLRDAVVAIFGAVRDFSVTVWNALRDAVVAVAQFIWDRVVAIFNGLRDGVMAVFNFVRDSSIAVWNALRDAVVAVAQFIWDRVVAIFNGLRDAVVAIFNFIRDTAVAVWNALRDAVVAVAQFIWDRLVAIFNGLRDAMVSIFNAIRDAVVNTWNNFRDLVVAVSQFVWDRLVAIFNGLREGVVRIFNSVRDTVVGVWNGFRDTVVAVAQFIWDRVVAAFTGLRDGAVRVFTGVRDTVVGVWNNFRDTLVTGAQNIWDFVVQRFTNLRNSAVSIFEGIRDTIGRVWDGLLDKVKAPIRLVFQFINGSMIGPINSLLDKFPGGLRIPTLPGFRTGGYTGDGRPDDVKGLVHAGEYVFTQEQVRRIGLPRIEGIANGDRPRSDELRGVRKSRDIGGPLDDVWDATGGKIVTAVGNAADWAMDMAIKGARAVAESVLRPLANTAKSYTPDNFLGNILDGFIDRLVNGVLGKSDEYQAPAPAVGDPGAGGVPAGGGSLGSNWSSLFATIKAIVPQARLNSAVRPGDPGAHGRGKAVDFGFGTGPGGAGSPGLALINRVLHDNFGGSLYELIYNGIGDDRPNLKNSRPLAYSAAIQAQHRNHVHAAVYDDGGLWNPGTAGFNFTNGVERVLSPRQTASFEQMVNANFAGEPSRFEGNLFLDSGEFLGKVQGVATEVVSRHKEQQDINDRRWSS